MSELTNGERILLKLIVNAERQKGIERVKHLNKLMQEEQARKHQDEEHKTKLLYNLTAEIRQIKELESISEKIKIKERA